jgi:hypothetical protein
MTTMHTTGVHASVAGRSRIEAALLEKKLGKNAFLIWQMFLQRRDFDGYSALTRRRIMKLAKFECGNQLKAVERALRRLMLAGLVVYCRHKRNHTWVMKSGGTRTRLLNVRLVSGDVDAAGAFVVPQAVYGAVMMMVTKGGARSGAGRPRKNQSGVPLAESVTVEGIPALNSSGIQSGVVPEFKAGTHSVLTSKGVRTGSSLPSEEKSAAVPPPSFLEEAPTAGALRLAATIVGVAARHTPTFFGPDLLPRLDYDTLNAAVVPSPPKLNPDEPDAMWALQLMRAYEGAVESRFKVKANHFKRKSVLSNAARVKPLVECAKKLVEQKIAPAAWAAWSCDVWRHFSEKKGRGKVKAPVLQWVFTAKRVEDNHGWFHAEESSFTGTRVVFGDAAREAMYLHQRVKQMLYEAPDEAAARLILARELPAGRLDGMIRLAHKEADAERTRLRAAVESGEWIWKW